RPGVGAFCRPVTRRGYHCRGQPGSAKGKPALVDRQNRRWLPGRFVVAGFGAVSKKCCLLRWDRGFESVFLQQGVRWRSPATPARLPGAAAGRRLSRMEDGRDAGHAKHLKRRNATLAMMAAPSRRSAAARAEARYVT